MSCEQPPAPPYGFQVGAVHRWVRKEPARQRPTRLMLSEERIEFLSRQRAGFGATTCRTGGWIGRRLLGTLHNLNGVAQLDKYLSSMHHRVRQDAFVLQRPGQRGAAQR